MTRAPRRKVLAALLVVFGASGCPAPQTSVRNPTDVRARPDLHGDPLALLPPGAVAWMRIDGATLRQSPHFDSGLELATQLGADLALVQRELGFDAFRQAQMAAVAIYLPPGTGGDAGWPVVYARGEVQREAILSAARARNTGRAEPTEGDEQGIHYTVIGSRAYMFPAPDVVLMMERGLVRRVAARLVGEEARSVRDDDRFNDLWREAGGAEGPFQAAMDLAAMRSRVRVEVRTREAEALDAFVACGDAPGDVHVRAAGRARDEASATMLRRTIDEARGEVAGQLPVRLLRLSRVLEEGTRTTRRERYVRVDVDATAEEAGRMLRAASIVREIMGGG